MDNHRNLAEIIEILETENKIQVTPGLLQLIDDLAHKINLSSSDEMAADHILIMGRNRQQIKSFLEATEVTLRIVRLCDPIKHECTEKEIIETIKEQRINIHGNRFKYLLLKWLHHYPFKSENGTETQANIHLFELMDGMRVVATISPEFNQLPADIKRKFRIQVDLDEMIIVDRNILSEDAGQTSQQQDELSDTPKPQKEQQENLNTLPDDGRNKLSGIIAICKFYFVDIKHKNFPTDKKANEFNEWKTILGKLKAYGLVRYNGKTPWTTPLAMERIFFE